MRIFVTGATGFIGSVVVKQLLTAGHQVVGLARSEAGAKSLVDAGAQVHRGDLEDLESLRSGAAASDGVIHLAFIHDFSRYVDNCETDRRAIETMGSALEGSKRPFVVTAGIAVDAPGRPATEDDPASGVIPRAVSEHAALAFAARGVRVSIVRLPQVHDLYKQGLVTPLIEIARAKGVSAYVGDGSNRWPAVHLLDCAQLYVLALEKGSAGARYHAVGEEGVRARDMAEVIGRRLNLPLVSKSPEEAGEHFGWLGFFAGRDALASSALTQQRLGWHPVGPGMLADLERAHNLEP